MARAVLGANRTVQQARPAVPVAASGSGSSPLGRIVLGIALALALLAVAFALMLPSAMPRPIGALIYERRSSLIFGYVATAVSIGLGVAIVWLS